MNTFTRTAAAVLAIVLLSAPAGLVENIPAEAYEHLTHTRVSPFLSNYHLVTEEQLANNYRGGEGGQIVYSLAVSSGNPDFMLMGNDTAGSYHSSDGGKSWHMAQSGIGDAVDTVEFYPQNDRVAFAICAGYITTSGIYKTEDSGVTWRRVCPLASGKNVQNNIKFGKMNADGFYTIYTSAATCPVAEYREQGYTGVFKSEDMGETWTKSGLAEYDVRDLWADRNSDAVIAACNTGGVMVSQNGGRNWSEFNSGLPSAGGEVDANAIAVDPQDNAHWIVAMGKLNSGVYDLYETLNSGRHWAKIDTDFGQPEIMPGKSAITILDYTYPDSSGKTRLMAGFYCTSYPFRISDDGGRTFTKINVSRENVASDTHTGYWPEGFAVTEADPDLVMAAHGLIARSDDGGQSFHFCNSGISGAGGREFVFDREGNLEYVGVFDFALLIRIPGYDGIFQPMQIDSDYPSINGSKTNTSIVIDPSDENHVFAMTGSAPYGGYSTMIETFDKFENYRYYSTMLDYCKQMSEKHGLLCIINKIFRSAQDDSLIYNTYFISEDNGVTWRESERSIEAVSPFDGDVVYSLNDQQGTALDQYKLYISYDRARTWQYTGITLHGAGGGSGVTPDLFEEHVLWVPVRGASTVYRVDLKSGRLDSFGTPNGFTADSGSVDLQMSSVAQDPSDRNHLVVTARDFYYSKFYLYETYDRGQVWERVPAPENAQMQVARFHPTEPRIYIGSMSGLYVYEFAKRRKIQQDGFLDIGGSFAYDAIKDMAGMGYVSGYEDGNFLPENPLTRAELAKIICGVTGVETGGFDISFSDVDPSDWYYEYAAAAVANHFMDKTGGDAFAPDEKVTLDMFKDVFERAMGKPAEFDYMDGAPYDGGAEITRAGVCYMLRGAITAGEG